jgi:hypothetical protein
MQWTLMKSTPQGKIAGLRVQLRRSCEFSLSAPIGGTFLFMNVTVQGVSPGQRLQKAFGSRLLREVVILGLAVTNFRRFSMEKESSSKRCCCIDNICKKMDDESACAKSGGRMVDSCTVCHY